MQQHNGRFISFEGIDGAGKSTHIEPLAQALRQQGRVVLCTREPGGTALAERLRELVLHQPMDPLTEALLVFAARRDHLQQVIEPALARAEVVLSDRFTDATFAYQGGGRGFDWQVLSFLERLVQTVPALAADLSQIRQPDLTFWFDLPPALAAQRLADLRTPDRFEGQSRAFFERVAAAYEARCQAQPQRFARIDASASVGQVWQQLQAVMQDRGWLT